MGPVHVQHSHQLPAAALSTQPHDLVQHQVLLKGTMLQSSWRGQLLASQRDPCTAQVRQSLPDGCDSGGQFCHCTWPAVLPGPGRQSFWRCLQKSALRPGVFIRGQGETFPALLHAAATSGACRSSQPALTQLPRTRLCCSQLQAPSPDWDGSVPQAVPGTAQSSLNARAGLLQGLLGSGRWCPGSPRRTGQGAAHCKR